MKKQIHREPLASDIIFKAVYGQDNPECKRALILLLNLILEQENDPIVDLTYHNPLSIAECNEKNIVMDIFVETQSGDLIFAAAGSLSRQCIWNRCCEPRVR